MFIKKEVATILAISRKEKIITLYSEPRNYNFFLMISKKKAGEKWAINKKGIVTYIFNHFISFQPFTV